MVEELLINANSYETRVALIADGDLQELHMARSGQYSATGNIYLGKVVRIVPGMQAAFVDVGLDRPGFLHLSDIHTSLIINADEDSDAQTNIRNFLHDGQSILVQVSKDPLAKKGARLTTRITLPAKFLVLTAKEKKVGISQKIENEEERLRLYKGLRPLVDEAGVGVIARTQSEGVNERTLEEEFYLLISVWQNVQSTLKSSRAPCNVYSELPIQNRLIRDLVGKRTRRISVDDANTFSRIQDYLRTYIPKYQEKLYLYSGQSPIFESYAIEGEIGRALEPRVQLKSGGSLVLEQTEALVSIDVNTSGFVAGANLQETVFKTNLEAAQTIPSQLRLRNLGGIIVIDFIDMATTENREKVLQTLKEGLARDPNKTFCDNFSELGLVLMSRKRTRKSLQQTICQPCDVCSGTGLVMSAETTCMEIVREIFANDANSEESDASGSEYLVTTTNAVIDRFLGEDANFMAQISATLNCRIRLQYDPAFMPGQFDIRTPKQTPV